MDLKIVKHFHTRDLKTKKSSRSKTKEWIERDSSPKHIVNKLLEDHCERAKKRYIDVGDAATLYVQEPLNTLLMETVYWISLKD
jgi:hypothetical protein